MRVTLYLDKTVGQNAAVYYDKAKKLKAKIEGAQDAIAESKRKLKKLEKEAIVEEKESLKRTAPKEWYEKFRWFRTSEGFLVVGGRDATTNEIVVKKHTSKGDLVFHTDMIGSPFFVIQSEGKEIGEASINETADATCSFSRAWKLGMPNSSVFYCNPDQLSKDAPSGEYVPRGGFITKGKLNYIPNKINCCVGLFEERVMAGPLDSIKKHCKDYVKIEQGREKLSNTAKKIQKKIGGTIDEIVRSLPSGGCAIKK